MSKRGELKAQSRAYLSTVRPIIESLADYFPLTLRQIYYACVSAGLFPNNIKQYKKLSRILAAARLQGLIGWECMEDRVRVFNSNAGWENRNHFINSETDSFLTGYRRDLMQSQKVALEIWLEKDALSSIFQNIAFPFCVPVIVARGFSSVTFVAQCAERVSINLANDKITRILFFSDFDPSGLAMLPAVLNTLREEMDLWGAVDGERIALNQDQIDTYNLPINPNSIKAGDSRADKFIEEHGENAVELDALPPAILEATIKKAIEDNINLTEYRKELKNERKDERIISSLRSDSIDFINSEIRKLDDE